MNPEIAPRLARNSVYLALKSFVALGLMLLVLPYALRVLGREVYGIWALVAVITSFAQLGDFGLSESVVKYAAEFRARRDAKALTSLLSTALTFYLAVALLLGGLLLLGLPYLTREVLLIPAALQDEALLVFRLSVGIFCLNLIMGVFSALLVATQQLGYATVVNLVSACLGAAGAVFFLWRGFGLLGLVATNLLVAVVAACLNLYFVTRLYPGLTLRMSRRSDRDMFGQLFSYGWKVQGTNFAQLLVFQFDRVLLSRYLGLEAVAVYEIGSNIALYLRTFVVTLFSPLLPAAAELQAQEAKALLPGLYRRSFRFAVLLAVPATFLAIGLAHPFMRIWMGPGFELSALTMQLLLPAFLVNMLTCPGGYLLNGIERPDLGMKAAFVAGAGNVLISSVLIGSFGYFGLVAGVALSLVLAAGYFVCMLHRTLPGIAGQWYWQVLRGPFFLSVAATGLLLLLDAYCRLTSIAALVLVGLSCLGAVLLLLARSNYLDPFERRVLFATFLLRRSS